MKDKGNVVDMTKDSIARTEARAARARARERIGALLPGGDQAKGDDSAKSAHFDSSPCDGWHVAAQLSYQAALSAPNINAAIECYLQGDAYEDVAAACEETLNTLP